MRPLPGLIPSTARRIVNRGLNPMLGRFDLALVRGDAKRMFEENGRLRWRLEERERQRLELVETLAGAVAAPAVPPLPPSSARTELLAELIGTSVGEALALLAELHECLGLDGDVAEFGVAQGTTSALLASEIAHTEKRLWLFDSFRGLPAPTPEDELVDDIFGLGSMERYAGTMASPREEVEGRLRRIGFPADRVRIVPGFIEETLATVGAARFCFAYVDLDLYRPIRVALEFLRDRLVPGGVAFVDDYGRFSAGAARAVDEFAATAPDFSLTFPPSWAGGCAVLRRAPEA